MTTLFGELEDSIQRNQKYKSLLQGPCGIGKTTTLLYLGHMARAKGYVVFPIQARYFVNQARSMSSLLQGYLTKWIDATGENIVKEIFGDDFFGRIKRLVSTIHLKHEEEKQIIQLFQVIVKELKMCKTKPVVFLIDQYNDFHANPQTIKLYSDGKHMQVTSRENPVGAMFLDWNTFKANRGGIFFGLSSAFQLMPPARGGNDVLFCRMDPMNRESFKVFVEFLVEQNRLPQECDCDDFYELCGGIPREAREFGSEKKRLYGDSQSTYQQWKDAYMKWRILFFKSRIQCLLDKEQLGPEQLKESVPFAARLFVGEKMTSAPDIWIASGLIVTKDGFHKLFCPAAEKAILSVFEQFKVTREAIEVIRGDTYSRWIGFELAVVYLFRKARGLAIELPCTDLCGVDKGSLMLTAESIQYGMAPPEAGSIQRSTLFVYAHWAPIIDFFIYDANGVQVLLQVSEVAYQDYVAKYDPNSADLNVYSAATQNPINNARIQYVYLTTNSHLMKRYKNGNYSSKYYRDDVLLVSGESTSLLFSGLLD
jgi:hypothetical protein